METILELLYQGKLHPYSEYQVKTEHFQKNQEKMFHAYHIFLNKLPEDLKIEFKELIDSYINSLPLELEQNFINGFCLGVQMMGEVYSHSDFNSET